MLKKLFSLFAALTLSVGLWATNTTVADLAALQTALSTVDTVYVSQTISLTDGTNLDAQGKVISVPKPYMAEMGMIAEERSNYSVFNIEGSVSIANATILGGNGDKDSSAGGINVKGGASLTMENVTIARSYRGLYIKSGCTAILKNCNIVRNVCDYGGGILLGGGNKLIMDGCSLSENRSLSRGGGAMEIQSGAVLYANNTVIANNSSSEIGGAINLKQGTAYLTNCTVSGNTNQIDKGAKAGAGIGNNNGTLYAANCIFMNNTFFAPGTEEPTSSDIGLYSGNGNHLINCIYGAVAGGDLATATNCKTASSTDAVFADYRQDGVLRLTDAQTPGFKHSILTRKEGGDFFSLYAPAQQFSGTGGVATYVDFSDVNNVKMAYYDGNAITSLGELSADGLTDANKVTTYYEPGTREAGVIGASAVDTRTYYTIKLIINEHVSVKDVTIYGESYPAGTGVPISHTTEEGFYFHGWNLDMAGTPKHGTGNPYNLTVNSDINVYPQVALEGAYSIFVDLPNKDYVFDVTSGSKQPINQTGYAMNTSVTVKAERQWYVLTKWLDFNGTELSTENPFTITMDADKSITPVWALDPNTMTVTILDNTGGKVTGLATDGKYMKGDAVTLTATPNIGYELKEWQDGNGNPISTSNPLSFTITQDTTIKPIFQTEQRSFEIATGVNARMGTLDKDYPWIKTTKKPGLAYMSSNYHDEYSDSRDTLIITPEEGISYRVKFDYAISSDYDYLSIWVNDEPIAEYIFGEESGSYDSGETLLTGPTTIVMSYNNDWEWWGEGDDRRGYIYNIVVTSDAPTVVSTTYIDENGVSQSIDAYVVSDASTPVTWGTAGQSTWYVVTGEDVQLAKGALCNGDVHLILADGAKLTATGESQKAGIQVSGDGNSLAIYGQAAQIGQLIAQGGDGAAGIGGEWGDLGSNITINGGIVTAIGGNAEGSTGAGIGGGYWGEGKNITINGGTVTAIGGENASSIGGGNEASASDIIVATNLLVMADGNNPPTTVIENDGTDLADKLEGKRYAILKTLPYDTVSVTVKETLCYQQLFISRLQSVTPMQDTTFNDTIKNIFYRDSVIRDSIYIYELKVLPDVDVKDAESDKVCYNTEYTWVLPEGNRTIDGYTVAGVKTIYDTVRNSLDCDSIIYTLNLTVLPDVVPQVYARTVTNGDWETICLPWASVALEGGTFYDVLGTKDAELGVALVELGESDQLTAGKPYVFKATSEQIKVTYYPATEVAEEVYDNNHIIGSFAGCDVPEGMYIIYNNMPYKTADATSTIAANRAYFDVDAMGEYTPSQAPGRKVVFMGGKTKPTGEWRIENGEMKMNGKYIMNGQFVIVRDGKMYNALGM